MWAPVILFALCVGSVRSSTVETLQDSCLSASDIENFDPKLLGNAMNAGNWKCAKEIAEAAQEKKVDCRNEYDVQSRVITQELSALKSAVDKTGPKKHISPAFRWAQSPTEIYVGIKFAHKLDAPMTSKKVDADNVTVTDTMIYLYASDPYAHKSFYLEIPLFGEVVPENSTWSMGSVGRMTLILGKKKNPSRWPRLMSHKNKVPNMHFWFEIDEQYSDALEELKVEKDTHSAAAKAEPDAEPGDTQAAAEENKTIAEKPKEPSGSDQKPEKVDPPVSPEAAALMAEKEAINKELKAKLAELDEEIRKRKNLQDQQIREAKAAIDKEFEAVKEEARKAAAERASALDEKLGSVLNAAGGDESKAEL